MPSKLPITEKMLENPYMLDYFRSMPNRMVSFCEKHIKQNTTIPNWVSRRTSELMIKRINVL